MNMELTRHIFFHILHIQEYSRVAEILTINNF